MKKIKKLELDLRVILGKISLLDQQTETPHRDYHFYQKINNLLEQAQKILRDRYCGCSEKNWPREGLLSLLRKKELNVSLKNL